MTNIVQVTCPQQMQAKALSWRSQGLKVGLVPTMGYWHEGHLSLMRWARQHCQLLVASIFVNPTQFAPGEDLQTYPANLDRDLDLAQEYGVDLVFCPQVEHMYGPDHDTWVEVPHLAQYLCGRTRPTHFRGVTTVVTKLFNLVLPDFAVFGQKDWQQLAIIKAMVRDLNMPVHIEGRPIVREADGLAMSSRNVYLTPEERAMAPFIYKGLQWVAQEIDQGQDQASILRQGLLDFYAQHLPAGQLDYLEFVHPDHLTALDLVQNSILIAVAMQVGQARLLDNIYLQGEF